MPRISSRIAHADLDAFFASVEQMDDPKLRGRPVIVGGLGRRGVVAAASYEARTFGVHSAMPTARARQLCPQGVYVFPRIARYAELGARVREVFDRFSPAVEPLALDEAFLDLGPLPDADHGGARAAELKRAVVDATGLVVSVGVAASKFVAKVASDLSKPDGLLVVPSGEDARFLAPLPVTRLWGAGPKTVERLHRFGLKTMSDVANARPALLERAIGSGGERFAELARGIDRRRVETGRDRKSIGKETTFEIDVTDAAACRTVLLELAEGVGRRLRQKGLVARLVRVKLRYGDYETHTRQRRLEAPCDDDLVLHREAIRLFEAAWDDRRGVRLLGVAAAELAAADEGLQLELFARESPRFERAQKVLDAIRDRFGEDAIGRGRESALPDRAGYESEER